MPSCNTVTCTGYSADVIGAAVPTLSWWLKNYNGDYLKWTSFYDESVHFGNITWIGINFANAFASDKQVATLRIFDCNNGLIDTRPLILPMAMTWGKWVFTASFGQTCHWALTPNSWGTGGLPDAPPPA